MENFDDSVRRHKGVWDGFVDLMFWSCLGAIVTLVLLAMFLL